MFGSQRLSWCHILRMFVRVRRAVVSRKFSLFPPSFVLFLWFTSLSPEAQLGWGPGAGWWPGLGGLGGLGLVWVTMTYLSAGTFPADSSCAGILVRSGADVLRPGFRACDCVCSDCCKATVLHALLPSAKTMPASSPGGWPACYGMHWRCRQQLRRWVVPGRVLMRGGRGPLQAAAFSQTCEANLLHALLPASSLVGGLPLLHVVYMMCGCYR